MSRLILAVVALLALLSGWTLYQLWERSQGPEGLRVQIEDLRKGDGPEIEPGQTVTVHYAAKVQGGSYYSETRRTGQPFTFIVGAGHVLPGWEQGLKRMRQGGLRRITIPPDLAYGERGSGAEIPPGSTLEVEIELLRVVPKPN
jgi:FKBP-type peptidyl-prolyl cis-trans isomerase